MAWLTQLFTPFFVNPALAAGGAALIASPIIIHLINRMRYRRVRFAAMEFLLQSQQKNRRRVLLEQLLLLLLRILVVIGLIALVARLILDPAQMSLLTSKAHHVVLLDDSGSMRDRRGETTAFGDAVEVVRALVADGARRPNTQKFSLLLASDPTAPLFVERDVNETFVNELETKLENLKCSHQALDLNAGLEEARKLLSEEKAQIRYLHLVSDFRRGDWVGQKALAGVVTELDEAGVNVNLVRTVDDRRANLAITSLTGDVQVAAAGVPLRLKVTVRNYDENVAKDVRVKVLQDGQPLPLSIVFDNIEGGKEVEREFDVVFDSPKKHRIHVQLEGDALSEDNERFLAVDVPQANSVLVIDGDPAADEAFYVAASLAPDEKTTGFAPLVESVDYLRRHPLDRFQSIYLLNVSELAPDALEPLQQFVAEGGGLVWYLGDAVKPAFYNDKLYAEGKGLFPVPLAPARRELPSDETNPGPDIKFSLHPIFERIFGQENPFSEVVSVYQYLPVADGWVRDDNDRKDGVRTIAILRNRQPFMFEHTFGKGRIITCLSSAGQMWNNWASGPGAPSYVTTQLELEKYIARQDRAIDRRVAGMPIDLTLDPSRYIEDVEIILPGDRPERLKASPRPVKPAAADGENGESQNSTEAPPLVANWRNTDAPGIYEVRLVNQANEQESRLFAYNFPTDESDLAVTTTAELRERLGEKSQVQIQEPGNTAWLDGGRSEGQEVRTALLVLLLAFLVMEQLMAYRLSYHPQTAGATA